ncbi:nucleotide sugar dehydrogenase [Microlunatus panaciterrae]|uniref:Nucleotide sugar dehydrogenase n=1 Tax=Microlunatus panaciterrae TaxID=400768 RepID=A0ABS2RHP6_9ACTN|nr:nucleotide sugar dehydrogenase [Microlunatus panaciterrae]MBM7798523.1 nucleotide sugar dehydrogenase [Microlunatus panaciterrae]
MAVHEAAGASTPGQANLRDHSVILGLGYVGLPLAQQAVRSGVKVVGLDLSERVVNGLNAGRSHVDDLSSADIDEMREKGFSATTDPSVIVDADTVVICVPTPLSDDGGPDLSAVQSAAETVGDHLRSGTLVVLESTTYPGTTDEFMRPILESRSGLVAGRDFSLAFSPERIDPGRQDFGVKNTPKVVGGFSPECTRQATKFYSRFIDTVVEARGTREAEMAKLLENTYRHVNIAMVNEMAQFCHELDIDLWNVIELAKTKPFGFQAFYPGPGVGGHCIPIDPNYLSHRVKQRLGYPFRFVELAQEINASMPNYVAQRAQNLLNADKLAINGATVLLLGVTYKANIGDQRQSPAVPLAKRLQHLGAQVVFHDPHVEQWNVTGVTKADPDPIAAAAAADLVILVQNHREYDVDALEAASTRFLDTRGVPGSSSRL